MDSYRVRLHFEKTGDLRLISHHDLLRTLERLFRRADVSLRMSEGFHPKPRMSFPSALGLGIAGLDEIMEAELAESIPPPQLVSRLNACAPPGLQFCDAELLTAQQKNARAKAASYTVAVSDELRPRVAAGIERLLAAESHLIERPGRVVPIELRELVQELELNDAGLCMTLRMTGEAGIRPRDVLEAIGFAPNEQEGMLVARTRIELEI